MPFKPVLVIPEGFAQASIHLRHSAMTHRDELTIGYKVTDDFDQGLHDTLYSTVAEVLDGRFSDNVTVTGMTSYLRHPSSEVLLRFDSDGDHVGENGSFDEASPQVCYLVKKLTARAGKRHRGRWFVPYPSESSIDENGRVAGATITAWNTALDAIVAAFATAVLEVDGAYILHHTTPEQPIPIDVDAPTPITVMRMTNVVATQRRRLVRT